MFITIIDDVQASDEWKEQEVNLPKWLLMCLTLGCPAAGLADEGIDTYRQTCAICHAVGVLGVPGVPKLGARADWEGRLMVAGRSGLLQSVLRGKGAMPPKGGNASLTDAQAEAALDYMLLRAGIRNGQEGKAARLPEGGRLHSK